jgi:adenylate cyclase
VRLEADANVPKAFERSVSLPKSLPLPDKPSIAVLPFTNMSGDPEQEYFSDGIADEIITELSRSRSLFVIARNSSFTYRGRAVPTKEIAHELGVRYVLEGSVRRSGGRVRVIAQLIDAETGNHIWAERYDREVGEVFAVQDEITAAAIAAILPVVTDAEQRRALRRPPESLGAWEAYQRGLWHYGKANVADNGRAMEFFERAIVLDGTLASAYSHLALALFQEGGTYATRRIDEVAKLAGDMARKAVENDPSDADALAVLAFATWAAGNREEAGERVLLALTSNTNSPLAHGMRGTFLVWSSRPSEGRDEMLTALRLNPRDPRNTYLATQIAVSYYFEHDYTSAVEAAKRAIVQYPGYPQPYRWLAAALGQLNRTNEAREALRQAMDVSPSGFDFYMRNRPLWFSPEQHEHMLEGLRKAGWDG